MSLINFFLDNKNTRNTYIYISLLYNKKEWCLKTPILICRKEWDQKNGRPVNIYLKKAKKINDTLNALRLSLSELIQNSNMVTREDIDRLIVNVSKNKNLPYSDQHLIFHLNKYALEKREFVAKSTFRRYIVFKKLYVKYESHSGMKIKLSNITKDFIYNFQKFCEHEDYNQSTINRSINFIKTILNSIDKNSFIIPLYNNVKSIGKKHLSKSQVVTLSDKDLKNIYDTKVDKKLETSKAWLLISCYTGQRISDFMDFNKDKLIIIDGKTCISFTQKKTKKEVLLPLHPMVLSILGSYKNNFPPKVSIQKYNSDIKKIAKIAQLNEIVCTNLRENFRSSLCEIEKWRTITSHIGRRSFATNFYGKIPTPLLMQATGHSSEQMFIKYINPVNKETILLLNNYFEKSHEKLSAG